MFEQILVPLDGTPLAEQALPVAVSLGRAGAHLHLATVAPSPTIDVSDLTPGIKDVQSNGDYLERVAARIRDSGVESVSTAKIAGKVVAEALEAHRKEVGAGLTVMCTHGRGAVQRAWLGSVADGLVRSSEAPVLLVRAADDDEPANDLRTEVRFERVLVALDGSHFSRQALAPAARLAGREGVEYFFARVIEGSKSAAGSGNGDREKARALAEAKLKLEVQSFAADGSGVKAVTEFAPSVAPGVLELARTHDADLIVVATHGLTGVRRLVLGSVADKIVRGADRPVLVVRPREA